MENKPMSVEEMQDGIQRMALINEANLLNIRQKLNKISLYIMTTLIWLVLGGLGIGAVAGITWLLQQVLKLWGLI